MSQEAKGLRDPLQDIRDIAEEPTLSSVVTNYAAHLAAREAVSREQDRGFSTGQIRKIRELARRHVDLSVEVGDEEFNRFLDEQWEFAQVRSRKPSVFVPMTARLISFADTFTKPSDIARRVLQEIKGDLLAPVKFAQDLRKDKYTGRLEKAWLFGIGTVFISQPSITYWSNSDSLAGAAGFLAVSYIIHGMNWNHPGALTKVRDKIFGS